MFSPTPELNLDMPYEQFVAQLQSRLWSNSELAEAASGLQDRIELIDQQLNVANISSRGAAWKTSTETARKYFVKKLAAVTQAARVEPPTKKPVGGHGFLLTLLVNGEHLVVATKRNPSELWAEMIAEEESKDSPPPALIAFLNLTEVAAKTLPETIWVDDL